jgi:hypothetical protein
LARGWTGTRSEAESLTKERGWEQAGELPTAVIRSEAEAEAEAHLDVDGQGRLTYLATEIPGLKYTVSKRVLSHFFKSYYMNRRYTLWGIEQAGVKAG